MLVPACHPSPELWPDCPICETARSGPTEAANALHGQGDDDDGNEHLLEVLNVAPSPTTETEHFRRGHPVNENTPGYMSMAFPTLFLDGTADFNDARLHKNHDAGRMTVPEIVQLLNDGDNSIAHNMIRYGAGLRGTRAYWLAR
ncbi:hypothetical protein BGY98DRAFT_933322 [Russula aff. rugulosa BPL654]|nr:hypothetical protein BGY98DRAFT_933322 [Russula aff. rugulosa BPL654]